MENQETYEVAARPDYGVVNFEDYAMGVDAVVRQVNVIQDVMHRVMKSKEHYDTIPGTNKPSLLKPGAEKLNLVFRLRPEYQIIKTDLGGGHREYEVTCTLYHIPTGQSVGQGVGSATTMEGKYRYRGGEKEGTGQPIPKEYWNLKSEGKMAEAQALIGGRGFAAGKIDGKWEICSIGEKVEHDNPADYYNTILKMAKKRAHVDAILTATAASDIFTQDTEDMTEVLPKSTPEPKKAPIKPPQKKTEAKSETATVKVVDVQAREGEKDGKSYKLYVIFDENEEKYSTFSETFAELASQSIPEGFDVSITYKAGQYGKNIINLERAA
jgi:hypothetical protein